ncbi:hypothetical protein Leryth_015694 [Lithospermum erythrorhizon]|nr:hypothetical protein Leryth_015694 [Lithospermum erythrorhizon]
MHPFCCISSINNEQKKHHHHQEVSTVPASPPGPVLAKFLDMPEPGPPSTAKVSNDQAALIKINELIGNEISGILYKWVNYGKGWRPRWFVLQDGVLSYYKIHGRHRIVVNQETEKGGAVIGERSFRRISRSDRFESRSLHWRPFGEVHLKVSSMRESQSDDRRFSIYTGTKTLHVRAETREDRMAWIEALEVARDIFPQLSNSDHLMNELTDVVMSTEKLRQRLLDEGVSDNAVDDCEKIMKSEFFVWRNRLLLLKQQQLLLVDTLRHLESEKVDLEYTVVGESNRQANAREVSTLLGHDKSRDGSMSELDDENDWHDAAEEDMDDDDDHSFLDSQDFLSSSSIRSIESDAQSSLSNSDNEAEEEVTRSC